MRKFVCLLYILLLCSCANDHRIPLKRIEEGYTLEKLAGGLEPLYGGGYMYVETDNGYAIETFAGCGTGDFFKNDTVEIIWDDNYDEKTNKTTRTYTYVSDELTSVLFVGDGKYHWENELYPSYPHAFEVKNTLYFTYYVGEELILNEIVDGELVEIKRYPVIDDEYTLLGFESEENDLYFVYENDESMKYICEENTYVFKKSDRVVVHPSCIFYSTFEAGNATTSYLIDRKSDEVYQLKQNVELLYDYYYASMPLVFNYDINDKGFIFVERINGKVCYAYGEWTGKELKVYRLPFEKHEDDECYIYKDHVIFYIDEVGGLLDFYVVTLKNEG